jgi:hypothetical protein
VAKKLEYSQEKGVIRKKIFQGFREELNRTTSKNLINLEIQWPMILVTAVFY